MTLRHPVTSKRGPTHYNTSKHTHTHYNTLQRTAIHCITLQHSATHCNTVGLFCRKSKQDNAEGGGEGGGGLQAKRYRFVAVSSSVLQRVAVCCSVMQCAAFQVCCSVLRCVAL